VKRGGILEVGVQVLARAGATITEGWPDRLDPARSAESFGFHVQLFLGSLYEDDTPVTQHARRFRVVRDPLAVGEPLRRRHQPLVPRGTSAVLFLLIAAPSAFSGRCPR
jgi:hypothetical protein